jgi:hypothetical protein
VRLRPLRRIATVRGAYRNSTRLLGVLTCALGVAMVVLSIARGGGPLALGVILGVCFIFVGAGRLYIAGQS